MNLNTTSSKDPDMYRKQETFIEEKTVEAPLSLFLQYYAAFFINDKATSFMTLWFSIMTSVLGISTGVYVSNHLQVLEELPEAAWKPEAVIAPPALEGVTIGVQPPVLPPGLSNSKAYPTLPPGLAIQVEAKALTDTE